MDFTGLFREHIAEVGRAAERSLAVAETAIGGLGGVVLHAGTTGFYHADDLAVPFRSLPHFTRFAPVPGADHLRL